MAGETAGLRRELGLFEVTVSGIGVILGAGIYALLGNAAGLAGNAVWLAFVLSAVMAAFTGLSYAELASMYPKAGAEYEYVNRAFGTKAAFVIGWLIIMGGVFAAATVALGFSGYFSTLTGFPEIPVAAVLLLLLCGFLLCGIKESAWLAVIFTIIEAGGLVFLIMVGLPYVGRVDYLAMPQGWGGVFQASALVFFAYTGFEGIVKLSEETKSPERTIPLALLLSLAITILLYILVAACAVSVAGWELIAGSQAPFAAVVYAAMGSDALYAISVIALFATANTALMFLLAASRITYGMAQAASLPAVLARVHGSRGTPWVAIVSLSLLSLIFLFFGDIAFVANVTNTTLFITFIAINAAVILLRHRQPDLPRPFRTPLSVGTVPLLPVLGIVFSVFLLLQQEFRILITSAILAVSAYGIFMLRGAWGHTPVKKG